MREWGLGTRIFCDCTIHKQTGDHVIFVGLLCAGPYQLTHYLYRLTHTLAITVTFLGLLHSKDNVISDLYLTGKVITNTRIVPVPIKTVQTVNEWKAGCNQIL